MKEVQLLETNYKVKQQFVFNQTRTKIERLEREAISKLNQTYMQKIEQQKEKNNMETLNLIKCFNEDKKLTEWSDCVSIEVYEFKDQKYIDKICNVYYGEENGEKCKSKKHFCNMCCDHHIGRMHIKFQRKCLSVCRNIVKGNVDQTKLKKHDEHAKPIEKQIEKPKKAFINLDTYWIDKPFYR